MLTESFIAATETVRPQVAHLSSHLKDVGIFLHEFQPQPTIRQGFKKSSVSKNCLAFSNTHIFAAQAGKAVVNVYNRAKCNQESTVPFPQKISSLAYAEASAILILGTQDGKLMLWEVATGRVSSSSASHIEAVTSVLIAPDGDHVISASADSSIHVWSIRNLVSLDKSQDAFENSASTKDPILTFSQHRSAILAIATGHSQHAVTNFVVSASHDKTCYIWNLETAEVLRTVLLIESPQCLIVDPADRAVYIGSNDGSVQKIDLLEQQSQTKSSLLDSSARSAAVASQLRPTDRWSPSAGAESGPAQCITLSYDGTLLLTGHASGKILQWEVAKHRMTNEVSSLTGQPVTNIHMLRPDGFAASEAITGYLIPTVVKPRLDLSNTEGLNASSGIPGEYDFHAQVICKNQCKAPRSDIETAMTSSIIPQSLLDAAIQSLTRSKVSGGQGKQVQPDGVSSVSTNAELYKIDRMEEELSRLRGQVTTHEKQDQERIDTHIARLKKREALGLQKREAFFAAKKDGRNGDEAMKPFAQKERDIDAESDDEALAASTTTANGHDIEMKG